jgi:hypothetical protein
MLKPVIEERVQDLGRSKRKFLSETFYDNYLTKESTGGTPTSGSWHNTFLPEQFPILDMTLEEWKCHLDEFQIVRSIATVFDRNLIVEESSGLRDTWMSEEVPGDAIAEAKREQWLKEEEILQSVVEAAELVHKIQVWV